jgi:type I restriction enzyme S subunit
LEVKFVFKKTDVGEIPEDWDVVQLADLKPFVTSGSRGWAYYYSERGDLFVRITNLSRASIYLDLTDCKFVKLPPEAREGVRTQLKEHDVLISITADIGMVGYVDANVPSPAYINQHIALVRFDSAKTSGKFVSYFLASEKPQKLFRAATDTGAKAGMSLLTVQKIQTALPPLSEQRAIAEALSDVDALIDKQDQLIAKKRDLKQAAMQQLLTGKKRLPAFHGEWVEVRVDKFAPLQRGFDLPTSQIQRGEHPVVYSNGVRNHHAIFMVKAPGVVTGRSGTIGNVHFIEQDFWPHNTALWVTDFKNNNPKFVFYFLTRIGLERFGTGSGVPTLNRNDVHEFRITVPPTSAEQTAIAEVLSDMDTELAALEQRREKTRALKQAMMQQLLTGKTRLL